jgi:hypothetical protein
VTYKHVALQSHANILILESKHSLILDIEVIYIYIYIYNSKRDIYFVVLEQDLPHPIQSSREGLIPFPHANLLSLIDKSKDKNKYFSLIDKSKDKNKYFSTCTHLASYTTSIYAICSTTAHVHRDLCQKIKIKCWVSMS